MSLIIKYRLQYAFYHFNLKDCKEEKYNVVRMHKLFILFQRCTQMYIYTFLCVFYPGTH